MRKKEDIVKFLSDFDEIEIIYLFGSRAFSIDSAIKADTSKDWDIGIVTKNTLPESKATWLKLELQPKLCTVLGTDDVDLVVVNHAKSIELARAIIFDGQCLLDRHKDRDSFERRILHEYEDHKAALLRNGFSE